HSFVGERHGSQGLEGASALAVDIAEHVDPEDRLVAAGGTLLGLVERLQPVDLAVEALDLLFDDGGSYRGADVAGGHVRRLLVRSGISGKQEDQQQGCKRS